MLDCVGLKAAEATGSELTKATKNFCKISCQPFYF